MMGMGQHRYKLVHGNELVLFNLSSSASCRLGINRCMYDKLECRMKRSSMYKKRELIGLASTQTSEQ